MGNGALYMEDEQQKNINQLFEIIDGIFFQFGFYYKAVISQKLKDKIKELKEKLIK